MSTFIIGSRENPIFPKAQPKNIIFINGSCLSSDLPDLKYANKNIVLSPHIFVNNLEDLIKYKANINIKKFKEIRKKLETDYFSNLYIRPTSDKYKFNFNYKNINCNNINIFQNKDFDKFLLESFDLNDYLKRTKYIFNSFKKDPKNIIKYLLGFIKIRMMRQFKISTGILGLMIAINDKKFEPPYYVIGIGLDNSGYSYKNNNRINNRKNHIKADLNYIDLLKKYKKINNDIIFTNKDLSDYFTFN